MNQVSLPQFENKDRLDDLKGIRFHRVIDNQEMELDAKKLVDSAQLPPHALRRLLTGSKFGKPIAQIHSFTPIQLSQ